MNARSAWKIGEFTGIGVYLHWTFFIVPALVAFSTLGSGLGAALEAVLFVLAIFGCVVLHEFGHALMARKYGIATHDITLYPIGGIARLDRIPDRPSQELSVALAGPAVNVVIAFVLFVGMALAGSIGLLPTVSTGGRAFLGKLLLVNVALVVFNMLPAFPMDGGRVLRAILAMNMPYVRATEIAAKVGQVMAVFLGVLGLVLTHWTLVFIAVFIYIAAGSEARYASLRQPVEATYRSDEAPQPFHALSVESRLANVADDLVLSPQHVFPVMAGPRFIGTLFKGDVLNAVANGWGHLTVGELMRS